MVILEHAYKDKGHISAVLSEKLYKLHDSNSHQEQ